MKKTVEALQMDDMMDGHKNAQKHSALVLFVPFGGSPILYSVLRPDQ